MGKIRDSVRPAYTITVAATGTGTIKSDPVKQGQKLVIQSVAFINETGARGTASLSLDRSGALAHLGDQYAPVANLWYFYATEQHVLEGERVRIDQVSCVANDVLRMEIVGYLEYLSEKD